MAKTPALNVKIVNEKETKKFLTQDIPDYTRFAVANTASRVVFLGLEKSEAQFRRDFILRNKFIVGTAPGKGALKFTRAIPHHDISKITASWGSPEKRGSADLSFLEEQEEGFTHKGVVPTEAARTSKSRAKRIRKANYMSKMAVRSLGVNDLKTRVIFFKKAFKEGFGLPGSNQFFYMKDNQYAPGWSAGFYQFSRKTPPGKEFVYPNLRRIYYDGPKVEKRRRAKKWMEKSKNTITQADIDRIYKDEFNKQFTRELKRRW